MMDVPFKV